MSGTGEVVTVARRLSDADSERRQGMLSAARSLASEAGYAAVTMRAVAAQTGVTHGTVYRYFSSKDHLLYAVGVDWAQAGVDALRAQPLPDVTAAERVGIVFARVLAYCGRDPLLLEAVEVSSISRDFALHGLRPWQALWNEYLQIALPGPLTDDGIEVAEILGHVLASCCRDIVTGRGTAEAGSRLLEAAARRLVPDT